MPEAGYRTHPANSLARAGVKDMVRISDGTESGTASSSIVLRVTPVGHRQAAGAGEERATASA